MNVTKYAIDKSALVCIGVAMIALGGLFAYLALPRSEDPDFLSRAATITTYYPGADPQTVELLVTKKLENVVQELVGLKTVVSESTRGLSHLRVLIQGEHTAIRPIWDSLRRKIARIESDLPSEVQGPYINDEELEVAGIIVAITGQDFSYKDLHDAADFVRDEVLRVQDVSKVGIYGEQREGVLIEFSTPRLNALEIAPIQVQQVLEQQNVLGHLGPIAVGKHDIVLEPAGHFRSIDNIENTILNIPDLNEIVYLKDIATVRRGYLDQPETRMRFSGLPAVGLAISMQQGGNVLRFGEEIRSVIEQAKRSIPIGIELDLVQFQPEVVRRKMDNFVSNLLQAIAVVMVLIVITLGLRLGVLVGSMIPISMLMTLLIMYQFGIGLNQLSLTSLVIALGLLVDNAIVMTESINAKRHEGKSALDASLESAEELKGPLLTSSLTTAAAFLPIYLAESDTGKYCAPLFIVVTIALLSSWILSLTMIPIASVRLAEVEKRGAHIPLGTALHNKYRTILRALLRHPWVTLQGTLTVCVLALFGASAIPVIFFPPDNDRVAFTGELELPPGTSLDTTEAVVKSIGTYIQEHSAAGHGRTEGLVSWAAFVGKGGPRHFLSYSPKPARPEYAYWIFNPTSGEARERLIAELEQFCEQEFPSAKVDFRPLDFGAAAWPPVQVRVSGRDPDVLAELANRVKAKIQSLPGIKTVDDDWGQPSKKLVVHVNQALAFMSGVTYEDIVRSLQGLLPGLTATELRERHRRIPITLQPSQAERRSIKGLDRVQVYSSTTERSVPLRHVADVQMTWERARIIRQDGLPTITIDAVPDPGMTAGEVTHLLKPWLEQQARSWEPGYFWEFGGEPEEKAEAEQSVLAKAPIAGVLILLLLVAQFNSYRIPLIILATIPLAFAGVVLGLLITGSYFGFMTLLGMISLSGIIINNAIVLLSRINVEIRERGLSHQDAILQAAQRRVRPILLTVATTVGGLLPLWLNGNALWESMAIGMIFGLVFATPLSLGVVPVLYAVFYRVRF